MLDFDPSKLPLQQQLDLAHQSGFRRFLSSIGHKNLPKHYRNRASGALQQLLDDLRGTGVPNYSDPYIVAAYLIRYHLSHCALAYWGFKNLFDNFGCPRTLYVCDIGAGTGAGRVGLALALTEERSNPTVFFDAWEPSSHMLAAGELFWTSFGSAAPSCLSSSYREFPSLPTALPRIPSNTVRIVTAFHLSLPYNNRWDHVGRQTKRSVLSSLNLVSPALGIFSCHENKEGSLAGVLNSYPNWTKSKCSEFEIPSGDNGVSELSQFYTQIAPTQGFDVTNGTSVRHWSRYRFSLPSGFLFLRST